MRRTILALSLWVAALARASGIDYPDQGAQAMGRGGAFAARADDPTAIYYNPAGLAKLRGWRLMVHSSFLDERLAFARAPRVDQSGAVTETFPIVQNDAAPFWLPFFAVTTNLGLPRATFAAGLYGPNANRYRSWPTCIGVPEQDTLDYCGDENDDSRYAPQRYMALRQDLFTAFPTIGGAHRVLPWLDVGAEFQATYAFVRVEQAMNVLGATAPSGDNRAFLGGKDGGKMTDPFTPAVLVGVLARPPLPLPRGHGLEVGLSWRSPITLRPSGDVDIDFSDTLSSRSCLVDPELDRCPAPGDPPPTAHGTLVMRLPWILRGGVRWFYARDGFEVWDVEVDGTFEPYSSVDGVDLEFDPPLVIDFGQTRFDAIQVIPQPRGWRDTGSVRVGGSYNFRRVGPGSLHLRAGANVDGAAAPDEYSQLDFSPFGHVGLAGGLGYRWRGVTLSFAYERLWTPTRTVDDSEIRTINTLDPPACDPANLEPGEPNPCDAVGNGTFTTSHNLFAVGLDVEFDALLSTAPRKFDPR